MVSAGKVAEIKGGEREKLAEKLSEKKIGQKNVSWKILRIWLQMCLMKKHCRKKFQSEHFSKEDVRLHKKHSKTFSA